MKNDFYWLIKHFDSETLDHIRSRFDRESGMAFLQKFLHLQDEATRLQEEGIPAESPEGLRFAKAYWDMVLEFTNGDAAMLPKLMQMGENDGLNQEWNQESIHSRMRRHDGRAASKGITENLHPLCHRAARL